MAVSLTHTTVATGEDAGNGEIRKAQWNENHTLTMATNKLLGRATAGDGAVEEIDLTAAGRALLDDADAAAQRTTLGVGTGDSPQFAAVNVGHAGDTTLSRAAAGTLAVEGKSIPYVIAQNNVPASVPAGTTEEVLATITIPGGAMGPNGWIALTTVWEAPSTVNNKLLRVRVGGISGSAFLGLAIAGASNAYINRVTYIRNQNSESSQQANYTFAAATSFAGSTLAPPTASVDTTADWDIVITGQRTVAGEVITLSSYQVIVCYGA